jgi:hypothetical protein
MTPSPKIPNGKISKASGRYRISEAQFQWISQPGPAAYTPIIDAIKRKIGGGTTKFTKNSPKLNF